MEKYFGIKPFGATPTREQLNHLKIGKKAFIHFGVNTFSEKEWGDGTERESLFNPTDMNVRGWIRDIKNAGFELAIITAKHHDGFCLWPSKYTEHSVKNSPYKNGEGDVIREFTDACHEYNIKAGIYISPWDRNSAYWGKDEYSLYYAKQLEELVTQYGRIDEIWWDGAGSGETKYDFELWVRIIKSHQPEALIFGSMGAAPYVSLRWVGNEDGYFSATQVSRQRARDEALEVLQSVVDSADADEATKTEALLEIADLARAMEAEANIETMVLAKGFERCVAVINGETCSVVVNGGELQESQIAQINEIVYEQAGILPVNIRIVTK